MAKLLKRAGIDFAILSPSGMCNGDPARRSGNEYLFQMLAMPNIEMLNGMGVRKIIAQCPHCFNTLKNEYPSFGGKYDVVHHSDYLNGLIARGLITPTKEVRAKIAYHDSCYLGRYNDVYESPREILKRIPGVELVEPQYWTKQRGLCCGAGGAQMWKEEQTQDRVNVKRTLQLVDALGGAQNKTIASACPFCMTMLTDGLKSQSLEEQIAQLDIAEILEASCVVEASATPEVPDTGSLREDVRALFLGNQHPLRDATMQRVFPQMIAAAKVNPEVGEAYRTFIADRRRPLQTILHRAIERGELPDDIDRQLVHDLLVAPLTFRFLVTDAPVDDPVIEEIIDVVLTGVAARASGAARSVGHG